MLHQTFHVPLRSGTPVSAVLYPAHDTPGDHVLVLAHGAGASQRSPFITRYATALAERGTSVVTFNFPYMEQERTAPDRAPALEAAFRDVMAAVVARVDVARTRLFIGGKSMGGRIATHLAAAPEALPTPLTGVVVFGYPLKPPGGAHTDRTAHLHRLAVPVLMVQGTRDRFGDPEALRAAAAGAGRIDVLPVEGGDHSFAVLKRSGRDQDAVHAEIWDGVHAWMDQIRPGPDA